MTAADERLVGRDDVLARLRSAVDDAVGGLGCAVLLTGEAGMGKSALLARAAGYAERRGVRVGRGWGDPGDGPGPYRLWTEVLRGLGLPTAALEPAGARAEAPGTPPEDAATRRFAVYDAVSDLLLAESRIQPVVVVLDDLQWADEPSLLLLHFLLRRLSAGQLTVVAARRDPGLDGARAPCRISALSEVIPLRHLTEPEVAAVVRRVVGEAAADPGLCRAVHRRTGGNPFFVHQLAWLIAAGGSGIPAGVREVLEQRFAALDAPGREALAAAGIVGRRVPADVVTRVLGRPAGDVAAGLAAAARLGVLKPEAPGSYAFAHDLFREHAVADVDPGRLARLHAGALRALQGAGVATAADLAEHALAAGDLVDRAERVARCTLAAREATARLGFEEAVRHWRAVVSLHDGAPEPPAGPVLELAAALARAGDLTAAAAAYARAGDVARAGGDVASEAHAALGRHALGVATWRRPDDLVRELSRARDSVAGAGGPVALHVRLTAALARVLAWAGSDVPRARRLADDAVRAARELDDPAVLAAALLAGHNVDWGPGSAARRRAIAAELTELAAVGVPRPDGREVPPDELLLEATLLHASDLLELADPGFRPELEAFVARAEAARQPRWRYAALVRRATLALLDGLDDDAERLIESARALGEECGAPDVHDVWLEQTWDLAWARGGLADFVAQVSVVDPTPPDTAGYLALTCLGLGERDRAAALAPAVLTPLPDRTPLSFAWLFQLGYGARLAAGVGDVAAGRRIAAALEPHADEAVVVGAAVAFKGAVSLYLGMLADLDGRPGDARRLLERALATHEALGAAHWVRLTRAHLRRLDPSPLTGPPQAAGVFHRDGDVWTLGYAGTTARMRHAKGLADLAVLLAARGRPVAAVDLLALPAGDAAAAGLRLGSDELLDETARRAVRERLDRLDADIAGADARDDADAGDRARAERAELLAALAAATGRGGRARRLGDPAERARKAVTGRIRDAIRRLDDVHPELAAHLRESVTTGTECAYSPASPVRWRL